MADVPFTVSHLTCEGLIEPTLIDAVTPRFSWRLDSAARGAGQGAFQLQVAELSAAGTPLAGAIETPRTTADSSQWSP